MDLGEERTLLNVVAECDNLELPLGPWDEKTLRLRREHHSGPEEFLVPFFVRTPGTLPEAATRGMVIEGDAEETQAPVMSSDWSEALANAADKNPIGFLRPHIVELMLADNDFMAGIHAEPVWEFSPRVAPHLPESAPLRRRLSARKSRDPEPAPMTSVRDPGDENKSRGNTIYAVGFAPWVNRDTEDRTAASKRHEHLDRLVRLWKEAGRFHEVLDGWRDEEYAIYGPKPQGTAVRALPGTNLAFTLERAACALFGFATFGVHLTAYVENPLRIWVARRSLTKQTWPGYLDNSVAGGIAAGDTALESIIRECKEEASLSESIVAPRVKATSCISYCYRTAAGYIQPEIQYCYDLPLPEDVTLRPYDTEVGEFALIPVQDVVQLILQRQFKPNCVLVLADFLVRHGILTYETDYEYSNLTSRLHRTLPVPLP